MEYLPLTKKEEIRDAYSRFERRMSEEAKGVMCDFGWQGGGMQREVFWHPYLKIWCYFDPELTESRYWCIFGTKNPENRNQTPITCEINFPFEGINRRVAAVFAKNQDGKIHLMHSGRVGGGRKGIGKKAFWEFLKPTETCILRWPDGKLSEAISLGHLDHPDLRSRVASFVHEVDRFKNQAVGIEQKPPTAPPAVSLPSPPAADYEEGLAILRHALDKATSNEVRSTGKLNYSKIVNDRDEVLARYQPIFNHEKVGSITADEFRSFLRLDNNHHWTQLHRRGDFACTDMKGLREGLRLLLDESKPISERLTDAIHTTYGIGVGIATAILMVAFPDKYGVWNNRSKRALRMIGIWPDLPRGSSRGEKYVMVNTLIKRLARDLGIDLWTIDTLFWYYDELKKERRI